MMDALAVDDLRKPQGPTHHHGIPRSVEDVGFAPMPRFTPAECRSRAGRLRVHHDFDREKRCIFCDAGGGFE